MILLIRNSVVIIALIFVGFIFFRRNQSKKLNWAIFYATLYTAVSLAFVNYMCIEFGFWTFNNKIENALKIPFDFYFVWIVLWGIVPVFFFKGKNILLITVFLFWLDLLFMTELGKIGLLQLNDNWLLGEVLLICFVFVPSYLWANFSYNKSRTNVRAIFQILVMGVLFIVGLPFMLKVYGLIESLNFKWSSMEFQVFLIVVFPGLVAVYDLVITGKGTPFPYDSTQHLVRRGVYAYCRNPIQWSFTLMFIPLSYYHNSFYLLLGVVFSVAYSFGVSDFQEYPDMEKRFGKGWITYKNNVPKWFFQWRPTNIPKGTIYFNSDCTQCSQIASLFQKFNTTNLEVKSAIDFPNKEILQATYLDDKGFEYRGVRAIAYGLEHLNLGVAVLAWLMKMPIINYVLQTIIDSMNFGSIKEICDVKENQ